jgi:acyl transferase domain-containing protein
MPGRAADPVAIVGMAALMPGADSLDSYWRNLVDGVDSISDVPSSRWDREFFDPEQATRRADRVFCRRGGFVDEIADFDPLAFGIMPAAVMAIEPDQLIALRVAAAAVDDIGGRDRLPDAHRVGVIIGRGGYPSTGMTRLRHRVHTANQLVLTLGELLPELDAPRLDEVRRRFAQRWGSDKPDTDAAVSLSPNLTASRIANRLDLRGPAYTIDAACASSLVAVGHAVTELTSGRCDAVIAGGVHHCHDISFWSIFSQLGALSRQGQIRPFDVAADGLLPGEGTGIVVLKRLADCQRNHDRVYAVIRGIGVSSDGRSTSLFNPERTGQVMAMRKAWAAAGLDPTAPDAVGLLEAHGTATPVGDTVEMASLTEVFGGPVGPSPAVIGSVKSMIGHTMPAAGIAGLIKAALAVHEGVLLPTLHCETPRPELRDTRFAPIATARPWEGAQPRRAAVNAFGFGGINSHVIIEQVPEPSSRGTAARGRPVSRAVSARVAEPEVVLQLAARDHNALAVLLDANDATVHASGAAQANGTARVAGDSQCRLGVIDPTAERMTLARKVVAARGAWRGGRDIWFSPNPLLADRSSARIGLVCPGFEFHPEPRVDDIASHLGVASRDWSAGSPTQQYVNLVELGRLLHKALTSIGVRPDGVVGYSFGEWTAAATAGLFDRATVDAILPTLNLDDSPIPDTALAVVGAGEADVSRLLTAYPQVVVSHDNAPSQCLICGPQPDVQRMIEALREHGIICKVLALGGGVHTPLLAPHLSELRARLERVDIHPPSVPIWSATIAAPLPTGPVQIRDLFARHPAEPVRFRDTIGAMYDAGFRVFLQLGMGQLTSVIGDNLRGRDHLAMPVSVPHRSGVEQLRRVATGLWAEGYPVDVTRLDAWHPGRRPVAAGAGLGPRGGTVRLDFSGAMVRLGESARELIANAADSGQPVPAARATGAELGWAAFGELKRLAGQSPGAAELAALLAETASSTVAVMSAARSASPPISPVPAPDAGQVSRPEPGAVSPVTRSAKDAGSAPPGLRQQLKVSLDTMPYLWDHCLFRQPDHWPDNADRFPVVPGTTMLHHMMTAAAGAAPGRAVTGARNVRFSRWVTAAPEQDLDITVAAAGPDCYTVDFGGYASAQVEVAATCPATRPSPWRPDPSTERVPEISANQLYSDRWLFHGPRFRGISRLLATGDYHTRAILATPDAPGGLLDNVGQLIGYWIFSTQPDPLVVFPVGMRRLRLFGPHPRAGTQVECVVRIRSLTESQLIADAQIIDNGAVWAQIDGWVDRRFDSDRRLFAAILFSERNAAAFPQPGGWVAAFDLWPDLPTRELVARASLGAGGYADYQGQPARTRGQWLLGQIAAKDAVRFALWSEGVEEIFPLELRVTGDTNGRGRVAPASGQRFGEYSVSFASCADAAVAIAEPRSPGGRADSPSVGIDIAEITEESETSSRVELSEAELRLLGSVAGERRLWLIRFRAAKEAAARADGSRPGQYPHQFTVQAATQDTLTIRVGDRSYRVAHRQLSNLDGMTRRRYVVAWTWGPESAVHHEYAMPGDRSPA